jgi:biopolymer transport protein ExbD
MNGNTIPHAPEADPSAPAPGRAGWLARQLLKWAAHRAPAFLRQRLAEEWSAHIAELPLGMKRLRFALGCLWAATVISYENPLPAAVAAPGSTPNAPARGSAPGARVGHPVPLRRAMSVSEGNAMAEINITPLIDVMLVLLVTLIVSLPTMTHAVKLALPGAVVSSAVSPRVIDLDIDSDGSIAWNGRVLADMRQLDSQLRSEARADSQPEIHLRPDRRARYDLVAKVLALAQHDHLQKVAFVDTAQFAN